MKNHSILTSVYPRLPFARRSIAELVRDLHQLLPKDGSPAVVEPKPNIGRVFYNQGEDAQAFAFVPNVLPELTVGGKEVKCHLSYQELSADSPLLKAANNRAIVEIDLGLRNADGLRVESLVPSEIKYPIGIPHEEVNQRSLIFRRYWNILDCPEVATMEFRIMIVVAKEDCPGYENGGKQKDAELAALRREHVARELTTGYRRYITHLLILLSTAAYDSMAKKGRNLPEVLKNVDKSCHVVQSGNVSPQSELHSTKEDAWRLLCTFHSVQVAAKKINTDLFGKENADYVLCLQDYVDSLTTRREVFEEFTSLNIIDELYSKKHIKREIALRKALEYYIYEDLPNMPN